MSTRNPTTGLTAKQQRFVEEYIVDMQGAKAAVRAGYSKSNARTQASQLCALPHVLAAIRAALDAQSAKTTVSKQWLIEQAISIAREARADKAHSAASNAMRLAAQLSGNLIERRETRQVQDWSDLTEEELRALAASPHPGTPKESRH
jgi:phage terminase small subunit